MTELQGDFVTLKPVTQADVGPIAVAFEQPMWMDALHENKPLTAAELAHDLFEQKSLALWAMHHEGQRLGYTGYRTDAGYPFILFCFDNNALDVPVMQDVILPMVHAYYNDGIKHVHPLALNDPFMIYLPHAQADELEGFLMNNGFDPNDIHWWPDYSKVRAYEILPNTYKAYFQDDEGEATQPQS